MITLLLFFHSLLFPSISPPPAEQLLLEVVEQPNDFDWTKHESPRDDDWMLSIIKNNPEMQSCFMKEDLASWQPYLKNFHFYDLNLDGLQDVIYQGGCKPYPIVSIFMQDEEGFFHYTSSKRGIIKELKIVGNTVYISTFSEACCCLDHSVLSRMKFEPSQLSATKSELLQYDYKTALPAQEFVLSFKTVQTTALRTHPKIDNTIQTHACFDEPKVKGNVVNEYEKNAKGYAFAKEQDEAGNLWYFVVFAPHSVHLANDYYYLVHVDHYTYAMGWVKAEAIFLGNK